MTEKPKNFEVRLERGPQAFSSHLNTIVKTLGGKYGFSEVDIIQNWATIVGPDFAKLTVPTRFKHDRKSPSGTLSVRVLSSAVSVILAHQTPDILDKINSFFGHRAVEKIIWVH